MQRSVAQTVEKIFDLIPDAVVATNLRRGRRTRGLIDAIGYTTSYLFGIATTSDLNELKEMLKKIEAVAQTEAADSARPIHETAKRKNGQFSEYPAGRA